MTFIAIWPCTAAVTWGKRGFNRRINALRGAVALAAAQAQHLALGQAWIFAAPEYAFGNGEGGANKPAVHVSTTLEQQFLTAALALSGAHLGMVLAPGTLPVVDGPRPVRAVRNTSYGFFNGAQVWRVDKRRGVGEISREEEWHRYMVFQSGVGYATANIAQKTYGIEICADACNGGTLRQDVDRHLIIASGSDVWTAHDRSSEFRIIADTVWYGVFVAHEQIQPEAGETFEDTELYYYIV